MVCIHDNLIGNGFTRSTNALHNLLISYYRNGEQKEEGFLMQKW